MTDVLCLFLFCQKISHQKKWNPTSNIFLIVIVHASTAQLALMFPVPSSKYFSLLHCNESIGQHTVSSFPFHCDKIPWKIAVLLVSALSAVTACHKLHSLYPALMQSDFKKRFHKRASPTTSAAPRPNIFLRFLIHSFVTSTKFVPETCTKAFFNVSNNLFMTTGSPLCSNISTSSIQELSNTFCSMVQRLIIPHYWSLIALLWLLTLKVLMMWSTLLIRCPCTRQTGWISRTTVSIIQLSRFALQLSTVLMLYPVEALSVTVFGQALIRRMLMVLVPAGLPICLQNQWFLLWLCKWELQ